MASRSSFETLRLPRAGLQGEAPEIRELLRLFFMEGTERETLFRTARELRRRHFGNRIFLYGFLYLSTYCRNDCRFCFYRRSNVQCRRYRKSPEEALAAADRLAASGVHLLDLTLGEDPLLHREEGFAPLVGLTAEVRRATGLPVMVSPGVVPEAVLAELARAGADWYACYQETHSRALFRRLRPGQNFARRLQAKRAARRLGLLVEEGVLCGVGERPLDLARSVRAMAELGAEQVRAMSFVPQNGIPLASRYAGDREGELTAIAVLRQAFPDKLIPASLDVDGLAGLERRLEAGANVVTSLIPPGQGMAGVARSALDIEEGRRTAVQVRQVLERCGLEPATQAEYATWIAARKREARCA